MSTDARLSTGLPSHPKTKKLIRRLGAGAGWSLICLILWARDNRSDGDLSGMSVEDIELAADWSGVPDAFVRELVAVGFLDGEEGAYELHDWAEHQPWSVGSEARSEKARWAALCKQHGRDEAARLMPEYAQRLLVASQERATSTHLAVPEAATSKPQASSKVLPAGSRSAPSPSPSPSPSPNTPLTPQGGEDGLLPEKPGEEDPVFAAFYAAYPRKTGRADAWKAWRALKPGPALVHAIMAGLELWKVHDRWTRDGGRFVKHPGPWLRGRMWEDDEVCGAPQRGGAGEVPEWCTRAGFDSVADAHNRMCWERNAHEFRDGARIPAEVAE